MRGTSRASVLLERRREELGRMGEQTAKNGIVEGKVLLEASSGSGQAILDVNFPVVFVEEPVPTFGYVLEENEAVQGLLPSCTSIVVNWVKQSKTDDRVYWTGCRLGVRVEAWEGILFWASYQFSGTSLQNPVFPNGTMGEKL